MFFTCPLLNWCSWIDWLYVLYVRYIWLPEVCLLKASYTVRVISSDPVRKVGNGSLKTESWSQMWRENYWFLSVSPLPLLLRNAQLASHLRGETAKENKQLKETKNAYLIHTWSNIGDDPLWKNILKSILLYYDWHSLFFIILLRGNFKLFLNCHVSRDSSCIFKYKPVSLNISLHK